MKFQNLAAALILAGILLVLLFAAQPAKAQISEVITIKPDGTIDPSSAPLTRTGNEYRLTSDLYGYNRILVQASSIVLNGEGHTVYGNWYRDFNWISLENTHDVTIEDFSFNHTYSGIYAENSAGITVIGNSFVLNNYCIRLENATNSTITGNTLYASYFGIWLSQSGNNTIKSNNITQICTAITVGWHGSIENQDLNLIENNQVSGFFGNIMDQLLPSTGMNIFGYCKIIGNNVSSENLALNFDNVAYLQVEDNNLTQNNEAMHFVDVDISTFALNHVVYNNVGINGTGNAPRVTFALNGFANNKVDIAGDITNLNFTNNYWSSYNGTGNTPYIVNGHNLDQNPYIPVPHDT